MARTSAGVDPIATQLLWQEFLEHEEAGDVFETPEGHIYVLLVDVRLPSRGLYHAILHQWPDGQVAGAFYPFAAEARREFDHILDDVDADEGEDVDEDEDEDEDTDDDATTEDGEDEP